ncbi:Hypothetical predicted protein, partial [Marmota monax]
VQSEPPTHGAAPNKNLPAWVAEVPPELLVWAAAQQILCPVRGRCWSSENREQLRAVDHDFLGQSSGHTHEWPCELQHPGLARGGQAKKCPGTF